jgi:hypothetical protein
MQHETGLRRPLTTFRAARVLRESLQLPPGQSWAIVLQGEGAAARAEHKRQLSAAARRAHGGVSVGSAQAVTAGLPSSLQRLCLPAPAVRTQAPGPLNAPVTSTQT